MTIRNIVPFLLSILALLTFPSAAVVAEHSGLGTYAGFSDLMLIGRDPSSRESTADLPLRLAQATSAERRLSRKDRKRIQEALNSRGFAVGRPDGAFGRNTRLGIARYQQSIDAPSTGELTGDQVDDLLHDRAQPERSAGDPKAAFAITRGVDLPGNDIAGPRTDRRLSGIGSKKCAQYCLQTPGCQAFTLNKKANACFLKSRAGKGKPFRNAVSGVLRQSGTPTVAETPAGAGGGFRLLDGTDLPGNDIATPRSDPRLANVSLSQCQAACAANSACRAFTLNTRARACFLKGAKGRASAFRGAVSGVRTGEGTVVAGGDFRSGNQPGQHDGAFDRYQRPDESEADLVARIRKAAVPFGGDCGVERAAISRIQREMTVTTDRTEIAAGEDVVLDWARGTVPTGNSPRERLPAYLMIATDRPVRFKGDGFYALMPKARAAFGIEAFKDRTRAIVPLYGSGLGKTGQITMRPLLAGGLKLEWSVVGYLRRCQEEVATDTESVLLIVRVSGDPTIVLDNEADLSAPTEVIGTPLDAQIDDRLIEVRAGRFRLVDAETRSEIAERAGLEPRFSPSGRFVAARSDDGLEVVDAVDGTLLHKDTHGGSLVWTDNDSFALLERSGRGIVTVIAPVHGGRKDPDFVVPNVGGRTVFQVATNCRICDARDAGIRIDRENNIAFVFGSQGGGAGLLSSSQESFESDWATSDEELDQARNRALAFVKSSQLGEFPWPRSWELGTDARLTHGWQDEQSSLLFQKPRLISGSSGAVGSHTSRPELKQVTWRGLARLESLPTHDGDRVELRMDEFGLKLTSGKPESQVTYPVFERDLVVLSDDSEGAPFAENETLEMQSTADRIKSEIPVARSTFVPRTETTLRCEVALFNAADQSTEPVQRKIYEEFQRAFRFHRDGRVVWITHNRCVDGSAAFSYPTTVVFDSGRSDPWFLGDETGDPEATFSGSNGVCYIDIVDCDFDAKIVHDRLLVLTSRASRAIEVHDIDERRSLFKKYNLPRGDYLQSVAITRDGRGVVQINADGSFFVYDLDGGRSLLHGRYIDDEIVVWTPDMRFDSTAEGAHFVNLKFPGQPGEYTFQQFDGRLRVPGLVQKVLSGEYAPRAVDVGVPPRLSGALEAGENGRVTGEATLDAWSSAEAVHVYQDGVLTDRIAVTDTSAPVAIDVPRLPGSRWVSLLGVDAEGLASLPQGRDLGPDFGRRAKVHVLSIGVDEYDSRDIVNLGLAVRDATTLADSVTVANTATLDVGDPTLLLDADASPRAILKSAEDIVANAVAGDTVVFFFAGHGVKGSDGRFYLATTGSDPSDLPVTALAWDDLATVLARSKARVAVFLDACHSGLAGTDFFATNDDAASGILKNIPSGLVVFSAAKGREFSREVPELGGGVFTQAVADVIARDRSRHDTNENGAIEVSELYAGVKRKVVGQTGGRQTPWLARNQMVGDFALF